MVTNYASAVRHGVAAAARIHREWGLRSVLEAKLGSVDIFDLIRQLDVPLILRPLQGLLGAYLNEPSPGILITTQRRLSVQRFTAAHELGHFILEHQPSLDDEDSILRRSSLPTSGSNFQEIEADAFAVAVMMPKWLIAGHMKHQGWSLHDLRRPTVAYQLSLRLGSSYEALCWTLVRYSIIDPKLARELLISKPRTFKIDLLGGHQPDSYRGDVWLLTERDSGAKIDGSRDDLFVIKLPEHSNGGYLWNFADLQKSGFVILEDVAKSVDPDGIGGLGERRVTAEPPSYYRGNVKLNEERPWDASQQLSSLELRLDLTGPEEEGLSRAERRFLLEAA